MSERNDRSVERGGRGMEEGGKVLRDIISKRAVPVVRDPFLDKPRRPRLNRNRRYSLKK